jgi:repressor LexA
MAGTAEGIGGEAVDPLTTRQREVLDYLRQYRDRHGYMPTVREVADRFNIGSNNGVVCHLLALEKKGFIQRDPVKARAIRLVGD